MNNDGAFVVVVIGDVTMGATLRSEYTNTFSRIVQEARLIMFAKAKIYFFLPRFIKDIFCWSVSEMLF